MTDIDIVPADREDGRPNGVFLAGTNINDLWQGPQLVFMHLAKLSQPHLTEYQSDWYHDALWLSENMKGQAVEFYYSFNNSGTSIGVDPVVVQARAYSYRLVAFIKGGSAYLNIESK